MHLEWELISRMSGLCIHYNMPKEHGKLLSGGRACRAVMENRLQMHICFTVGRM